MSFLSKKVLMISVVVICFIGSVFLGRVFSYNDTVSHPTLTENIVIVYGYNFAKELSNDEVAWLKWGSIEEDTAPRWMRHFYDPNLNLGLFPYMNSKDWAQSPADQATSLGGNHTWQKAIDSYVDGDKKVAFIALGHVLHLLEDATVPAHTRLDPHPNGDPYEKWVEENKQGEISFDVQPTSANNLSDAFYQVASYSNKYFLSEDTINFEKNSFIEQVIDKKVYLMQIDNQRNVFKLAEKRIVGGKNFYTFDQVVHADYFNLLGPKAVSYGAGVIDLFFKEAEKEKQRREQESWWNKVKNWLNGSRGSLLSLFGGNDDSQGNSNGNGNDLTIDQNALDNLGNPPAGQDDGGQDNDDSGITSVQQDLEPQENNSSDNSEESDEQNSQNNSEQNSGNDPEENSENNTDNNQQISSQSFPPTEAPQDDNEQEDENQTQDNDNQNQDNNSNTQSAAGSRSTNDSGSTQPADNNQNNQNNATTTIDTIPPIISNINVGSVARTSAIINFQTDEGAYGKVEYGTSTLYAFATDWETATSTSHAINLLNLSPSQTYHFLIWAKDETGNTATSTDQTFTTSAQADNVVISELATSGSGGVNDEWIELYNPTNQNVDLSDWSIQYRGGNAEDFNKRNFTATSTIAARGFFLIANSAYTGGAPADLNHNSFQMSGDGGNVFLVNNHIDLESATSTAIIDKVAYGAGANLFPETTEFTPAPGDGESLERKDSAASTAESLATGDDKWQGNGYDSDNNSQDFVLQISPTPQNLLSLTEPRNSFPVLDDNAAWPMPGKNEKRQNSVVNGPANPTAQLLVNNGSVTFTSPPAIGQSKIYIGASDGIHAFDLSGAPLWFYASGDIQTAPVLASDDILYVNSDDAIFSLTGAGILRWNYSFSHDSSALLNIDKNGVVYIASDGKLYAFYPDGKVKWQFDPALALVNVAYSGSGTGSPAIDNQRERIYVNIGRYLYALNFDGTLAWKFTDSSLFSVSPTWVFTTPAVDDQGIIYVSSYGSSFPGGGSYAFYPDGTVKWFNQASYSFAPKTFPAIGSDNQIYFSATKHTDEGHQSALFSFSRETGEVVWDVIINPDDSPPIFAGSGVYVAAGTRIRALGNGAGNTLWQWPDGGAIFWSAGFGAADGSGHLYFASNGQVYRLGD